MTLRVAHIITMLELGGAQGNTLYTVTHLDRKQVEPFLICGRGGMLDDDALKGNWPTHFLDSLVRPLHPIKDVVAAIQMYRLLRLLKPQIAHTHSSKAGILGRIAAYLAGVPVIIHTFHGFGFTPDQPRWLHTLYVWAEKFCAKLSTHLIFVSEDNRQEASALGIGQGVPNSLIHSGIHLKAAIPAAVRSELKIPPSAWVVASVGNFKPQKNPMDLARVARAVVAKDPSVHFVLLGDGPLRAEVENWVSQQNLSANVHFTGWRRDAAEWVAGSDAFLLTSLWEGLPRALVEAGAQRKPSVAYAVNGVKDLLKEGVNGFPIEAGQWEKAAEQLLWLRQHPVEALRMGTEARRQVETGFDIDQMVKDQQSLYTTLYNAVPLKETYGLPTFQ